MADYYEILGVAKDANDKTIRDAYKKLAVKYHPDRNKEPGAEEKFKEIAQAYAVLSDKDKKERYDKYGTADDSEIPVNAQDFFNQFFGNMQGMPPGMAGMHGMPGGFASFTSMPGMPGMSGMPPGFPDLSQFFGQESNDVPPVELPLELSLEEIFTGCKKDIKYQRYNLCSKCENKSSKCKKCNGNGSMRISVNNQLKEMKCKKCNGRGLEGDAKECNKCSNVGFVKETHQETIDIPRGVNKSTPVIIPNKGNLIPEEEVTNSSRSDLVVIVIEKPHKLFHRGSVIRDIKQVNYNNLVLDFNISLEESLTGFNRMIEHLDGKTVKITYSETCSNGDIIVLKKQGMYKYNSNSDAERGDLLIKIKVTTRNLTAEEKEKIWKVLSKDDYKPVNKTSSNITKYSEYQKEEIDEHKKESMKENYRRRRQGPPNDGGGEGVQCATQ